MTHSPKTQPIIKRENNNIGYFIHSSQSTHVEMASHKRQTYQNEAKNLCTICVWLGHIHTHTRLTALCLGLPGRAGTRKVKPIWILLEQETVSGSGISWAIGKSAPRSRQITTPTTQVFFTGRMPFLPPNQQCQSTEGICVWLGQWMQIHYKQNIIVIKEMVWWSAGVVVWSELQTCNGPADATVTHSTHCLLLQ